MSIAPNRTTLFQSAPNRIWYTRCPVPTTSGIAQHHRWLHENFAKVGVGLDSIRASADQAVRDSHYNHSHPAMFREGGNVPPIWTKASGQDTAVVGITWVDEEQVILVRPDSEIVDLNDLRSRRFGLPRHRTRHVDIARAQDLRGIVSALGLAGLTTDDVELVDILGGEYDLTEQRDRRQDFHSAPVDALLAGQIDAIYAKGAVSSTLIQQFGLRPVVDINANPDPFVRVNAGTPRPITVNRDLAIEHPEIVARYLAVLLKTAEWAADHSAEVVATIAAETGATEDAVRRAYGPELHRQFTPSLSERYVAGLEQQKNFLRDWSFIPADIDFDTWIVREPLLLAADLVGEITL